jgi:hypothetical protein
MNVRKPLVPGCFPAGGFLRFGPIKTTTGGKKMKKLLVTLTLVLTACTAFASEPSTGKQPSPNDLQQIMEMSLGSMVPLMTRMTEATIEAQLKIAEKPETAGRIATFKKNLYDALVKQGFSKKEALDIMMNTAMPSAMPGMK